LLGFPAVPERWNRAETAARHPEGKSRKQGSEVLRQTQQRGKRPNSRAIGATVCAAVAALVLLVAGNRPAAAGVGDTMSVTVQKGVNYLTEDAVWWTQANQCVACHRQGAALFGLSQAKASGYAVDESDDYGLGYLAGFIQAGQSGAGNWVWSGGADNAQTAYAFFGLAGYDKNVNTRYSQALVRAADFVVTSQLADGRWAEDFGGQPVLWGDVGETTRMMIGLAQAKQRVDPVTAARYEAAIQKAAGWIRAHKANLGGNFNYDPSEALYRQYAANNRYWANEYRMYAEWWPEWAYWYLQYADQLDAEALYYDQQADYIRDHGYQPTEYTYEIAYGILGLKTAGAANDDPDVIVLRDRLLSWTSAATGQGWGDRPESEANPYNTGLALYALGQIGINLRDNVAVQQAAFWLRDAQEANGSWGPDIPTTFALLGLSSYGELGVQLSVNGPDREVVKSNQAGSQTAIYDLTLANQGAFDFTDTYDLTVLGGFAGWTGTLSQSSVTLGSGLSAPLTLQVYVPPAQPEALPVEMTVIATSRTNSKVSASIKVTTFTDPPPPSAGQPTSTKIVAGGQVKVISRTAGYPLAARVTAGDNSTVVGPGRGVVTFYVAGAVVGTDRDADGDGIYGIKWVPGNAWRVQGEQDLRAVYSGIELGDPKQNLMPSLAASTITIALPLNSEPAADAGKDQKVEATGATTTVQLDGSGSSDPDGDALAFDWKEGETTVGTSATPKVKLAVGTHTFTLTVTDPSGATSSDTVTIKVVDTTAPAISVPTDQVAEATGPTGAAVSFTTSATDTVDGSVATSADPASGSTFPLGDTTVTVTAVDQAGNKATKTFKVTVEDTTAPEITAPGTQTAEATSAAGAAVSFSASASDIVDGPVAVSYSHQPGSVFPVGETTVTVTAKDAAGNKSTKSFVVKVQDTTAPAISGLSVNPSVLTVPNHKMVDVTVSYTVSDNTGATVKLTVTSSEPDNGLGDGDTAGDIEIVSDHVVRLRAERSGKGNGRTYTITVTATDAYGNTSSQIVTVSVPKSGK
jgi:hypothetical protein